MDGLFLLVTLGLGALCSICAMVVPLAGGSALLLEQRSRQVRREALERLGLTLDEATGQYEGTVGGFQAIYRPLVLFSFDSFQGFCLHVPTGTLALAATENARDTRVWDGPFDVRFQIHGQPGDIARLTAKLRAQLMQLPLHKRVCIEHDWVGVGGDVFDPGDLADAWRIARALSEVASDPEERLLRLATEDPLASVRRRGLLLASEQHPALAARIARRAQFDTDPQVRAESAIILREPELLVRTALDPGVLYELRGRAANTLGEVGSETHRLRLGQRLVIEEGLELYGVALLRSVGEAGEPELIEMLASEQGEILERVILALGEVGTIRAVPALRDCQARLSILQSRMHWLAERSIRQIQESSGGEKGGLSLATGQVLPAAGGLSVAVGPGRLALSETSAAEERTE